MLRLKPWRPKCGVSPLSSPKRAIGSKISSPRTKNLSHTGSKTVQYRAYKSMIARINNQKTASLPHTLHQTRSCHPIKWALSLLVGVSLVSSGSGQSILVPNSSFESPTTPQGFPAIPQIDIWQKTAQPVGVPLPNGITWDQLSGVFPNTPPSSASHIDNVTESQAAYLFAIPGVGLSQTLTATFEVGKSYALSVGALGGGGISAGSSLQLDLFYLDGANAMASVAVAPITFTAADFPNSTHLLDFQALSATVGANDPWAGKQIGVRLLSTFGTGSGYWDVDNIRLFAVPEPGTGAVVALGICSLLWARARSSRRR